MYVLCSMHAHRYTHFYHSMQYPFSFQLQLLKFKTCLRRVRSAVSTSLFCDVCNLSSSSDLFFVCFYTVQIYIWKRLTFNHVWQRFAFVYTRIKRENEITLISVCDFFFLIFESSQSSGSGQVLVCNISTAHI